MCALRGLVTLPQLDKLASDGEGNQEAEAMLDKSEVESFVCGVTAFCVVLLCAFDT